MQMAFRHSLPDGADIISTHIAQGILLLQEARELVKDRIVLEREYARGLDALNRKHSIKLDRKVRDLTLGSNPPPAVVDPGPNTVMNMWSEWVANLDLVSKERVVFADRLVAEVSDKLKLCVLQFEDNRKKHMAFFSRLNHDLIKLDNDRDKAKLHYLQTCEDVESSKIKYEKADIKNQDKFKKIWQKAIAEMNTAKNSYLMEIQNCNVARKTYRKEQLPWILDELENLQQRRIEAFKTISHQYVVCEQETHASCTSKCTQLDSAINKVDAPTDIRIFAKCNTGQYIDPPEVTFEGTTLWCDRGDLVTDDQSCVILRNHHSKLKMKLSALNTQIDTDQKQVNGLNKLMDAYTIESRLGDPNLTRDELMETQARIQLEMGAVAKCQAQIQYIEKAIGDLTTGSSNTAHAFKPSSFKLPVQCVICNSSIWGRNGLTCKGCGTSCHVKCELKVPSKCTGGHTDTDPDTVIRSPSSKIESGLSPLSSKIELGSPSSNTSRLPDLALTSPMEIDETSVPDYSLYTTTSSNRSTTNSPPQVTGGESSPKKKGTDLAVVLYEYMAAGDDEMSVTKGQVVHVLPNTGSDDDEGWTLVKVKQEQGLVPSTYIHILPDIGTGMHHAQVIYTYEPQGEDDLDVCEGDIVYIVKDHGDGWMQINAGNDRVGHVPASYVQVLSLPD